MQKHFYAKLPVSHSKKDTCSKQAKAFLLCFLVVLCLPAGVRKAEQTMAHCQ